jgi:hypothetical protein
MSNCPKCGNTGWIKIVDSDGVVRYGRCPCQTKHVQSAGGFTKAGNVAAGFRKGGVLTPPIQDCRPEGRLYTDLEPVQRHVYELIAARHGEANAIKIATICELVPDLDVRSVKGIVATLREIFRIPIAATKVPPYGYFIPATAEECDDCHDRFFREGIKLIKHSQLFRPDRDLVERLRGQLELNADGL